MRWTSHDQKETWKRGHAILLCLPIAGRKKRATGPPTLGLSLLLISTLLHLLYINIFGPSSWSWGFIAPTKWWMNLDSPLNSVRRATGTPMVIKNLMVKDYLFFFPSCYCEKTLTDHSQNYDDQEKCYFTSKYLQRPYLGWDTSPLFFLKKKFFFFGWCGVVWWCRFPFIIDKILIPLRF